MTIKEKARVAFWSVVVFVRNAHTEFHNRRLENKRRSWVAHRVGGGGVVPLGRLTQDEAIEKVVKMGSVRFVDTEVAIIIYSDESQ